MLLAPILAVMLALFLAAAFASLPQTSFSPTSSPTPSSAGTQRPLQMATVSGSFPTFIVFIAVAVIVGILAALLFFRQKSLNKQLSEN